MSLEQRYGATVLAALLLGDPIPGLGDDLAVDSVAFQASQDSPVDDLLITGNVRATRTQRKLSIGVRRAPTIGAGDKKFVKLIGDALSTLQQHAMSFEADRHRLSLAVADPNSGAQELSELADHARGFKGADEFYKSLGTPGLVADPLRKRFVAFEKVVKEARKLVPGLAAPDKRDICWRLLRSLWVHRFRLEEDASDRTHCVQRLRTLVSKPDEADALFDRLCVLAAQFAKTGAEVDRTLLRRELAGRIESLRDPSSQRTWEVFDSLAQSLRDRTPGVLRPRSAGAPEIKIDRADALKALVDQIQQSCRQGNPLVVAGDPGVGKSALVVRALDQLAAEGAAVTMLSLRDVSTRSTVEVEQLLGGRLTEALAATGVAPQRLLLLDGAEVVQEGAKSLVLDFGRAAQLAGVITIAVTRADAEANVVATLKEAVAGTTARTIETHRVEGFGNAETEQLVSALPAVQRLAADPRSKWLLQRPGLLKLVVEHDLVSQLPSGPISETVVYGLVWQGLVRRNERIESDGATPDGRETAVRSLAQSLLFPGNRASAGVVDPRALSSLRSDGVLLPIVKGLVWRTGDQFASDLLRDIAVTQLIIAESPRLLLDAGVPRWSLYALRIACQSFLVDAKSPWTLKEQVAFCKELSEKDGERWLDVPWEAALTIPDAGALLGREWPLLIGKRGQLLLDVIRVLVFRFGGRYITDALVGAQVVSLLSDHANELRSINYDLEGEARSTILRWLRGVAVSGSRDVTHPLRVRVRDALLASEDRWGDSYVECLSLLGPDMNDAAAAELRRLSVERVYDLSACIEGPASNLSMAAHSPGLLLELAERYYIEPTDDSESRHWASHDYGIRNISHGDGARGLHSGWYYGPFRRLLDAGHVLETVALINRMLNHAARIRVEATRGGSRWFDTTEVEEGIDVDLPSGPRHFIGDGHVWRWYCGRGVGSYPCMSALLALEAFVDELFSAGVPLERIAELLLKDAESLAMAGLVYGTLVRHIEKAGELLDPWLATPEVWFLENERSLEERQPYSFAVRKTVSNHERHRWDAMTVAYYIVVMTVLANRDEAAAARLKAVGHRLVEHARRTFQADADDEAKGVITERNRVVSCRRWAAALDFVNYQGVPADGKKVAIEFVVPADIAEQIEKGSKDLLRGRVLFELQHRYGLMRGKTKPTVEEVRADLKIAEGLVADPPKSGPPFKDDGPAALAATAIEMHHDGQLVLSPDEFALSLSILLTSTSNRFELSAIDDVSINDLGADRFAARVLPLLLLPSFRVPGAEDELAEIRELVLEGLGLLAKSRVIGVRVALVEGLRAVWATSCDGKDEACPHRLALDVILDAARYCRLGPLGDPRQFAIDPLPTPLASSLPGTSPDNLSQTRLAAAVGAVADCAASCCCVADEAFAALGILVSAYGAVDLTNESSGAPSTYDDGKQLVAGGLLRICGRRDSSLLTSLIQVLLARPDRCSQFLDDLAQAGTYGVAERTAVKRNWPVVMMKVLDAVDQIDKPNAEGLDDLLASVVPRPRPKIADEALSERLRDAGRDWIEPAVVAPFIERWITHAVGLSRCVDSIAGFFMERMTPESVETSLDWLERTIDDNFAAIAGYSFWLVPYLKKVFESVKLPTAQLIQLRRIVDALVSRGDGHAFELQQAMDRG